MSIDKTYGDDPFDLDSTWDTFTVTSSDTAVATVSGNTVTIVGAGECDLDGVDGGGTLKTEKLTVAKATQTVTFDELIHRHAGSGSFTLAATVDTAFNLTYTSDAPAIAMVTGATCTPQAPGSAVITAKQAGSANYEEATATQTQVVLAWVRSGTTPADVLVDVDDGQTSGLDFVSGQGDSSAGDSGPKYLLIDVPDYYGNGTGGRTSPRSYLHLGAAPSWGTVQSRGDDLLAALGLTRDANDEVNDKYFIDDWRDHNAHHHKTTTYHRDSGTALPLRGPWPAKTSASQADHFITRELLKRGGWRDHTDGNRVVTTRGDRVDVIGGQYRLVVLGRRWQQSPLAINDWKQSYWEASGGFVKEVTNTPSELSFLHWVDYDGTNGAWRWIYETTKGNTINKYSGVGADYFQGPVMLSRTGSAETGVITKSARPGPQEGTDQRDHWLNPYSRQRQNPNITSVTTARAIYSDKAVKKTTDDTTEVTGTAKSTTDVDSDVTTATYTPEEISGSVRDVGNKFIDELHEETHVSMILSSDTTADRDEQYGGSATSFAFRTDIVIALQMGLEMKAGYSRTILGAVKFDFSLNKNMTMTFGLAAEAQVGLWFALSFGPEAKEYRSGPSYNVHTPFKTCLDKDKNELEAVKMKKFLASVKGFLKYKST